MSIWWEVCGISSVFLGLGQVLGLLCPLRSLPLASLLVWDTAVCVDFSFVFSFPSELFTHTSSSQSPWGRTEAGGSAFGCRVWNMKCPPQLTYLRILSSAGSSAWRGGCDTLRRQPSWRKWVAVGRASLEVNNPALLLARIPALLTCHILHTCHAIMDSPLRL